jgi:hypothetical protein
MSNIKKNWEVRSRNLQMLMEAGSSNNPFRRAKLPSSPFGSFGSFGSLMPEGERTALEGLCNLVRSIAPELLSEDPSADEVIDCFIVFSGDAAGKHDRSKQALELALIATALLNFKASLLQPFQQQAGAATNSSSTASAPTARQIQILSWENDSFTKAHRRVGEVQNTLRMLSNDLKHSSRSGRISRRRRVIQLFDQTLEILSPHVASLADRIRSYIHGAHKEEEDLGGISEDEEDVLECKNDPDAKKRPGDRGFAVRSALERMMQGSGRRRRVLRICEHLSEIRDRLCDEAMNLPDLTTEERGQRMELHRQIGEAVAAKDALTLKTAIRAIIEGSCLCPKVSRELRLMEMPDPLANQETS